MSLPRLPKQKIVSGNFNPPVIPTLTPADWSELERLLHASIPSELRKQVFAKMLLYSCAAPTSRQTISISKAVRAIEVWQNHTSRLLKTIWPEGVDKFPKRIKREVIERRLAAEANDYGRRTYLWQLGTTIRTAVLESRFVIQQITNRSFLGTRSFDLWMLWILLTVRVLREFDIPITRTTKRRVELSPNFINFIEKLQSHLPVSVQRRTTKQSLFKGLNEVAKVTKSKMSEEELTRLMVIWGFLSMPDWDWRLDDKGSAFGWHIKTHPIDALAKRRRRPPLKK